MLDSGAIIFDIKEEERKHMTVSDLLDMYSEKKKEEFDNEMREIKQHEEKMQEEISKVNHHSGPCIPGAKKIFVTAEGNIYPCERVSEISEVSKIGDIKKGIDKNKVLNLLNIERYSQDRCKDCWAYE